MDRNLALMLTVFVGGLVALQAPINSTLGRTVGSFQGAAISFSVGLIALLALAALTSGTGTIGRARELEWYYLVAGGLIGAAYVTSVLVTVRSLGAGGVTAATIAGQLAMSVLIDHFGLLGLPRAQLNASRVLGIALLAAGAFLIVRD
ncbi:MAG: DMT family transporter [Actinomycetota bacterium]|nr:DMT family transporter [Actinomycetota bacterium]